ncbi:MAG: hypothetical protein GY696_09405, partial [Gammaproteobacteria bacterium]|nr:hypothetical protein [Gammaproteobacteria bacterium]
MRETPTSIDTTIPVMVKNSILTRLENGARKRSVQAALLWPGGARKDIPLQKLGSNWDGLLPRAVCWYAQPEVKRYVEGPDFVATFPGVAGFECPWVEVFHEHAMTESQTREMFPRYQPEGNTFDRASYPVADQVPFVPRAFLMLPGFKEKIPSFVVVDIRQRVSVPARPSYVSSEEIQGLEPRRQSGNSQRRRNSPDR